MKKNKIWIYVLIVIILIIIGGVFLVPYIQSVTGFSTLALSKVSFESDSEYLDGEQWVLTVAQGTLAQRAQGTFTPENIEDVTGGETTKNNFQINVNYQDQTCEYNVVQGDYDAPIYKLALHRFFCVAPLLNEDKVIKELEDNGISENRLTMAWGAVPSISFNNCWAIYWTEKTIVARFENPKIRSKMNIAVLAGTRSDDVTLDTLRDAESPLSDFAYVVWVGNLDSGKQCPSQTPYRPVYKSDKYVTIDDQMYERYINVWDDLYLETLNKDDYDFNDLEVYINSLNNKANIALVSKNFGYYEKGGEINNAILKHELIAPLIFPVLTFYVKAETLGIYTPSPSLKMISADSPEFDSGNGIIYITVKNIGDEDGTWNFYGDCNSGFEIPESRQYSIGAGQTKTVTLPLQGESGDKTTGKCTIYAENVAGVESIDVTVTVNPFVTCQPNSKFCGTSGGKDVVFKCDSDGAGKSVAKECTVGQICENAECKDDNGNDSDWWDKIKDFFNDIGNFFTEFVLIISIVVGLLATIAGYVLYERFAKIVKIKENKLIAIIVGVLLGFLAGYLFYSLFWWGIAALIIYIIISFIIPKR